jgi:hypothetical protein
MSSKGVGETYKLTSCDGAEIEEQTTSTFDNIYDI